MLIILSIYYRAKESRDVELSSEIASKIYAGKSGEDFFDDLVSHMTSGACKVLVLSDVDAVEKLKKTIGPSNPEEAKNHPDTIRGKIASSIIANGIHAPRKKSYISSNICSTKKKILRFLVEIRLEKVITVTWSCISNSYLNEN